MEFKYPAPDHRGTEPDGGLCRLQGGTSSSIPNGYQHGASIFGQGFPKRAFAVPDNETNPVDQSERWADYRSGVGGQFQLPLAAGQCRAEDAAWNDFPGCLRVVEKY